MAKKIHDATEEARRMRLRDTWHASSDVHRMLYMLDDKRFTSRKSRRFLCNIARDIMGSMNEPSIPYTTVEDIEQFADVALTPPNDEGPVAAAWRTKATQISRALQSRYGAAVSISVGQRQSGATQEEYLAVLLITAASKLAPRRAWILNLCAQMAGATCFTPRITYPYIADMMREMWGNPYEPPLPNIKDVMDAAMNKNHSWFDSRLWAQKIAAWYQWQEQALVKMLRDIDTTRAYDSGSMSVLGDLLEDAGCDEARILEHCRNGQRHYQGCWVVDHLLCRK